MQSCQPNASLPLLQRLSRPDSLEERRTSNGRADGLVDSDTEVLPQTPSEIRLCPEEQFLRWLWNKTMEIPRPVMGKDLAGGIFIEQLSRCL